MKRFDRFLTFSDFAEVEPIMIVVSFVFWYLDPIENRVHVQQYEQIGR
jgi:hypothetical protein